MAPRKPVQTFLGGESYLGTTQGVKRTSEAVIEDKGIYPRTIEKDGYFCSSAKYDPFPNWPVEKIYVVMD